MFKNLVIDFMSAGLEEVSSLTDSLFTNVATDDDKINLVWKITITGESWHL